jgi:hypothetical protein
MNKASTQRFAVWAVLVSLGWLSFLWINGFGLLFFSAAWFVAMPREQLHRIVPRRELLWMACILVAFLAVVLASKILTPGSAERALDRFFSHPAVIIPLWLLCLWLGFRGWRRTIRNAA